MFGPYAYKTMSFLAMAAPPRAHAWAGVRVFTPRRVVELEPWIRELAGEYLDEAVERGELDFIRDFAGKLPMDVISELIGVPKADRAEVRRLSDLLGAPRGMLNDVPPAGVEAALRSLPTTPTCWPSAV